MTLQRRALWLAGVFFVGGVVLLVAATHYLPSPLNVFALVLWVGGFGAAFMALRCPHCGESAIASDSGIFVTPFVGSKCRRCGKDY